MMPVTMSNSTMSEVAGWLGSVQRFIEQIKDNTQRKKKQKVSGVRQAYRLGNKIFGKALQLPVVLVPPALHHDRARHRSKPATKTIAAAEGRTRKPCSKHRTPRAWLQQRSSKNRNQSIDSQVRDEHAEEEAEKAEDQYPAREQPPFRGGAAALGLHLRSFRLSPLLRRRGRVYPGTRAMRFVSHTIGEQGEGRLYASST